MRRAALPKYLQTIDTLTPLKAAGLGVVLSVVNPKNLMMIIAGALVISQADLSDGDTIIAVLVFVLIAISTVAVPVILYIVMGERASRYSTRCARGSRRTTRPSWRCCCS